MIVENVIQIKDYIWNPAICSCKNNKYLASIINDSVTTCNEIIDRKKKKPLQKILIKKSAICKAKFFYILFAFLSITIALLIAVCIYCYLIKYRSKQEHLLTFYVANNKPNEFYINNIN